MRWKILPHILMFLILFYSIFSVSVFAVEVDSHVDKKSVLLGEEITYDIEIGDVDGLSCRNVVFPNKKDFLPFVVKAEKRCYKKSGKIRKEYSLAAFQLGKLMLSGLKIRINEEEIAIPDVSIEIKSILPKDIEGINPKTEKGLIKKKNYFIWFIILILISVLSSYIAYRIFTRQEEDDGRFHSKRTYWEIAWDRLLSLEKKNLPRHRLWKQFYYELTEILRYFIQNRFSINALEMTSTELQFAMKNVDISQEEKKAITEILFRSDPVKYAGMNLVDEHLAGEDLAFVKHFVDKYSPKEEVESK